MVTQAELFGEIEGRAPNTEVVVRDNEGELWEVDYRGFLDGRITLELVSVIEEEDEEEE